MQILGQRNCKRCKLEDDVQQEVVVVADTDAVVDPGAVVVETLNAVVADLAVSASACADCFAVRAQLCAVNCFQKVLKVNPVVSKVAGLSA